MPEVLGLVCLGMTDQLLWVLFALVSSRKMPSKFMPRHRLLAIALAIAAQLETDLHMLRKLNFMLEPLEYLSGLQIKRSCRRSAGGLCICTPRRRASRVDPESNTSDPSNRASESFQYHCDLNSESRSERSRDAGTCAAGFGIESRMLEILRGKILTSAKLPNLLGKQREEVHAP